MGYKGKVALGALITILVVALVINSFYGQEKTPYDYSDYYVPSSTLETTDSEEGSEGYQLQVLSLELLKQTNEDVVGIIEFDDRMIYEPIVQAPDNEYYVRRNIERKYTSAGIPFISADSDIDATNVVVYGHSSTESDIIFTSLMNYLDKEFYLAHPSFDLILEDEVRTYEIVAVLSVDLNDYDDSLEWSKSSWRNQDSYAAFLTSIKEDSIYETGSSVSTSDKLMTLVTCDTRDDSKRIVIIAKQVTTDES